MQLRTLSNRNWNGVNMPIAVTVRSRVVILIDDGLATGSKMRAAAAAPGKQGPARIIVADGVVLDKSR